MLKRLAVPGLASLEFVGPCLYSPFLSRSPEDYQAFERERNRILASREAQPKVAYRDPQDTIFQLMTMGFHYEGACKTGDPSLHLVEHTLSHTGPNGEKKYFFIQRPTKRSPESCQKKQAQFVDLRLAADKQYIKGFKDRSGDALRAGGPKGSASAAMFPSKKDSATITVVPLGSLSRTTRRSSAEGLGAVSSSSRKRSQAAMQPKPKATLGAPDKRAHLDADATSKPTVLDDHWVSNGLNEENALGHLQHLLGLTPQKEFESGTIAAGLARIVSTVLGKPLDLIEGGAPQTFFPVNRPEIAEGQTEAVGHVAAFLRMVQHIAMRTDDLVTLLVNAKKVADATGYGFQTLPIQPAYYSYLPEVAIARVEGVSAAQAKVIYVGLSQAGIVADEVVNRGKSKADMKASVEASGAGLPAPVVERVANTIWEGRYSALKMALGDSLPNSVYDAMAELGILVDIQSEPGAEKPHILMQLFTKMIQPKLPDGTALPEAPFLEFIKRICAEGLEKPGCGGFGTRNFLLLYLMKEVGTAMHDLDTAKTPLDTGYRRQRLDLLLAQFRRSIGALNRLSDSAREPDPAKREALAKAADAELKGISSQYEREQATIKNEYEAKLQQAAAVSRAIPVAT